ncbi:hypothetical protein [Chromobacterium sp. IIBBL 290-4]|uniref:hypothetical protein n=1 Tax=Chromobacterium sp. IIBBL 290-4 TaxID=2953890 RepID=UPI0020B8FA15|nr:hypothetical protein [Chromobacterium sp. IIBBL 290-4]UTH73326.1 hypothetical protein NKT35_17565 [Chromobacterium sp. IIBBL 290-4]
MSAKINFFLIVKDHLGTLSDVSGRRLKIDIFTFYGVPFLFGVLFSIKGGGVKPEVLSMLVNFGAIFTALLLSVLMLVYEQQNKLEERNAVAGSVSFFNEKKKLLEQLYSNISYSVVVSMLLVMFSLFYVLIDSFSIELDFKFLSFDGVELNSGNWVCNYLIAPFLIFITVNLILTILMVVKRTYSLLTMKI